MAYTRPAGGFLWGHGETQDHSIVSLRLLQGQDLLSIGECYCDCSRYPRESRSQGTQSQNRFWDWDWDWNSDFNLELGSNSSPTISSPSPRVELPSLFHGY